MSGGASIRRGFTLIELLLTLVLILILAGAVIVSFDGLNRSAGLDEGLRRFQSLIRFAQAEAATTGRNVRIEFVAEEGWPGDGGEFKGGEWRRVRVLWEADPVNAPGTFQTYTNKTWSEAPANELIAFEQVTVAGSLPLPAAPQTDPAGSLLETNQPPVESRLDEPQAADVTPPGITFFPDGTCDSAELILVSRNPEDTRRVAVRLSGILGAVSIREQNSETNSLAADEFDEAAFDPDAAGVESPFASPAINREFSP